MDRAKRERLRDRILQNRVAGISQTEALELLDYIDRLEELLRSADSFHGVEL